MEQAPFWGACLLLRSFGRRALFIVTVSVAGCSFSVAGNNPAPITTCDLTRTHVASRDPYRCLEVKDDPSRACPPPTTSVTRGSRSEPHQVVQERRRPCCPGVIVVWCHHGSLLSMDEIRKPGRDYADNSGPLTTVTRTTTAHAALSTAPHCARNAELRITSTDSGSRRELSVGPRPRSARPPKPIAGRGSSSAPTPSSASPVASSPTSVFHGSAPGSPISSLRAGSAGGFVNFVRRSALQPVHRNRPRLVLGAPKVLGDHLVPAIRSSRRRPERVAEV